MCQNAKYFEYVQWYDSEHKPLGLPCISGSEQKIPKLAVCFRKYSIFVCVHKAMGREFELASEKFWASNYVYPEATFSFDMNELEKQCRTPTEFSLLRDSVVRGGLRLIKNRLGLICAIEQDDIVLNSK